MTHFYSFAVVSWHIKLRGPEAEFQSILYEYVSTVLVTN